MLTKALAHRQAGVYDVLLAQQEDVSNIYVIGRHIHTEKLLLLCMLMLHGNKETELSYCPSEPSTI